MNCPESDEEPNIYIVIVRIGGENRWTLYEKSVFYFSIPKEKNCTFVSYINKD